MSGNQTETGKLWQLQQLDLECRDLQQFLTQSQLQEACEKQKTTARGALQQLKKEEKALLELRKSIRQGELELATVDGQIKELEETLYGGNVTNSRELSSLEKKLQLSKEKRSEKEEFLLEAMEQAETGESEIETLRAKATKATRRYRQMTAKLEKEQEEKKQRLAAAKEQRKDLEATIDPQWLSRYEKMWKSRQSDVIARIEGSSCGACRVSLPGGLISQAATGSQATYCESCGRILYVPKDH